MKTFRFIVISALFLLIFLPPSANARPSAPPILGSARFTAQVHQALALLKAKDQNAYAIVTHYVGRIQEGPHSGMWAYKTPPIYEMSDTTAFSSLTWCSATIAHDSFHSKLYHDYLRKHGKPVPDVVWTGTKAEQECMSHQVAVMERIQAPQREIAYAKKQAGGNYVPNNETWAHYKKRNW